ncbi:MAG: hypothetical protein KGQ89_05030, partial [Verrucomicrobia bacterium]|nr:hypothetical protein [Verrucomicrobiota bacterium]
ATKRQHLLARREELQGERAALVAVVDREVLPLYDRLMKTKNGSAVVHVGGGLCSGCHMKLVPTTLVKVLAALELVQCENCGRLLYSE